ncbi:hypothetical protein ACIVBQ_000450 [Tenacibaculum discolor]
MNYQSNSKSYSEKEKKKIRESYRLELLKKTDTDAFLEELFDDF